MMVTMVLPDRIENSEVRLNLLIYIDFSGSLEPFMYHGEERSSLLPDWARGQSWTLVSDSVDRSRLIGGVCGGCSSFFCSVKGRSVAQ